MDSKVKLHERLREAMFARKAQLEQALASNLREIRDEEARAVEVVERAADGAADDLAAGLAEIETAELAQIDNALRRLDEATYGLCADCNKPIPQKRLRLLPFAVRCVKCTRQREQNSQRPAYNDHAVQNKNKN